MQNAKNTEIQQRVMNLVNLYRTKVGGVDSENYKAVYEYEQAEELRQIEAHNKENANSFSTSVTIPDDLAYKIKVNEQLLGHFYKTAIGKNYDEDITNRLCANFYDNTIFSQSDESYLISHFKEMVNYIISTPNNQQCSKEWDEKDIFIIPQEVLNLICEHVQIPSNAIVYNPFTGFAQFATKLNNCNIICEDGYFAFNEQNKIVDIDHDISAWTKVILAANEIDTNNIGKDLSYDAVLSYIPYIPVSYDKEGKVVSEEEKFESYLTSIFLNAYKQLKKNGKMGLIIPNELLWKGNRRYPIKTFWEEVICDGSLSEIIQLPSVMSYNCHHNYCMVVITKESVSLTTITDARFASKEISNTNVISMDALLKMEAKGDIENFVSQWISMRAIKVGDGNVLMAKNGKSNFINVFDINRLKATEENGGKDTETGLRKIIKITTSCLNVNMLVPQVYVVETPSNDENPVPLSTLCSMVSVHVSDIKYNLPNDTPWVGDKNLSYTYQGELDLTSQDVEKAKCPNIPPHTDDYVFKENGELDSELPWAQKTEIGKRVVDFRNCYYLDGKKDAVLFKFDTRGPKLAIVRATQRPLAVDNRICVFVPNAGVDAFRLYVLLSMPLVYRQIQAIKDFGIYGNLHNVIIPTDQRIVGDEEKKTLLEGETYKNHEEKLQSIKTEYINEVRMRKHDMGQYIFELSNIEDLMRYYLDNRETEKDFCQQLESLLDNFRSSLGELSTLLANLSKEEQFGEPELFNIDEYLSNLKNRHKADGFKIEYSRDELSINSYYLKLHIDDSSILDDYIPEDTDFIDDYIPEEDTDSIGDYIPEEDTDSIGDYIPEEDTYFIDDYIPEEDTYFIDDYIPEEDTYFIDDYIPEEDTYFIDDYIPEENTDSIDDVIPEENADSIDDVIPEENADSIDDVIPEEDIDILDLTGGDIALSKRIDSLPNLFVSPNDIQRLVSNIIDNARKHGFTDPSRKDYEVKVRLSIDAQKNMFQMDFSNNGNPLPEGMNKMRYGIKGEKAGKTGGTGIGGSYIKKFVEHYGGDYDVFMDNGWTVIRIYLPIR